MKTELQENISLHIGGFADPIWKQLKEQGVPVKVQDCVKYQKAVEGFVRLRMLGCMGDKEADRICQRLAGKILKFAKTKLKT